MFQNLNKYDFLLIVILLLLVVVSGYYYANPQSRNLVWLKMYPIRAELSARQISCSNNSPPWLTDILKYQARYNNAPTNQIAYIEPNGVLHHCENGYKGKFPLVSNAIDEYTRFRYASVTKLWTADAILSLIKNGQLSLDTKLADIITNIDNPKDIRINDITIRQLLSHRAGFDRYSGFGNDMFGIGQDICPNHLQALNSVRLGFSPDSKTSYSNLGYCLLGEVIHHIENKPYTEVIANEYGFADSSLRFISNTAFPDEVSYNYVETGITGVSDIYTAFDYEDLASAAGLSGNAIDLAQQVYEMAAKPSPNILSTNKKAQCDFTKIGECYGYAMIPYQSKSTLPMVYYRDGNLLGLSSLVAVSENGSTVTLLSNGTPNEVVTDANEIKMMIYAHLVD